MEIRQTDTENIPAEGPQAERSERTGWTPARPEKLPRPTYYPLVLAFGITLTFFGVVTTFVISGVGLILFGVGLAGWVGELRHEA
jgi:hypothetical protein